MDRSPPALTARATQDSEQASVKGMETRSLSAANFTPNGCAFPASKRNGGLGALPRPSPVICGYWTKAIALPREPKRLHFRIHASPRPVVGRNPLRRAPWRLAASHLWKNRHLAHRIEGCIASERAVASCAVEILSAGATLGHGARCPRPQSPHVRNI
jgi:hypothetical protein